MKSERERERERGKGAILCIIQLHRDRCVFDRCNVVATVMKENEIDHPHHQNIKRCVCYARKYTYIYYNNDDVKKKRGRETGREKYKQPDRDHLYLLNAGRRI